MAGEWTAQLSDDLKDNEAFTSYGTLSDFAKGHLETVGKLTTLDGKTKEYEGKITDLSTKLENAIFKPGEKATEAERAAYKKSLGVPESPDGYEFPKIEGLENDPMTAWAKQTFLKYDIPAEAGKGLYEDYRTFVEEFSKAYEEQEKQGQIEAVKTAEADLKKRMGSDYDKNIQNAARFRDKIVEKFPELGKLLEKEYLPGVKMGNVPEMTELFSILGKAIRDDFILPSNQSGAGKPKEGMVYDKSPTPPNNQ